MLSGAASSKVCGGWVGGCRDASRGVGCWVEGGVGICVISCWNNCCSGLEVGCVVGVPVIGLIVEELSVEGLGVGTAVGTGAEKKVEEKEEGG